MFSRSFVGGHLEKGRGEANSEHARLLGGLRKKKIPSVREVWIFFGITHYVIKI